MDARLMDSFARLLSYPTLGYVAEAKVCRSLVGMVDPAAADHLGRFMRAIEGMTREELEELYVRTFDLNPICALEVGWQLFGDSYERGAFLVEMKEQLRSHGLAESAELPDHLSRVLPLMGRMETARANAFSVASVLPALSKMRDGLKSHESPYQDVLAALTGALGARDAAPGEVKQ